MDKWKYGTPEYELEESKKKIDSALEKVSKIRNDIGKIEDLEIIKIPSFSSLSSFYNGGIYNRFDPKNINHLKRAWEAAEKYIDENIKRVEDIHDSNKEKIGNNEETAQKVRDFMISVGIKPSYAIYDYPTNRHKTKKSMIKEAGYVGDIRREIKTTDNYKLAIEVYENGRKKLENEFNTLNSKIIEENKKKELEEKKQEEIKELARFQVKYENNGEWGDILDVILNKNKYLRLGHFLLKNREDWNEGTSYAKAGISGFEVENEEDQRIADEIWDHIENWDGDGRCFRDCRYNYDYLFSLVDDEELMENYNIVEAKLSW